MYMSKLHTFLLLPRTLGVSAADLRGACLAYTQRGGLRSAVKRNVCLNVVELGAHTTGVKDPLLRACSSSAALRAAGLHTHVRSHRTSSDPAYL